ncbi:TonB-linked outer membrane protein, SusC/RagA family [Pedobacter nyackensis]|uniref:TonB-linked outer membrane protein, SusC/RagA family n=2 Tax=Pedobacter nyackensis TaxID=475255 RepID=A0A1W2ADQ2_9SPHI|nr:TonB-linked outer membrane protein, SusC/RagA family [Pedobacter nyackensis]
MYFINTSHGVDEPRFAPIFKLLKGLYKCVPLIKPETRRQIIMRINLMAVFMTLCLMQAVASGFAQVTLHKKNAALNDVLKSIKQQTNYTFLYNSELLKDAKTVSVNLDKASIEEALKACFENQDLTFKIIEKTVLLKKKETGILDKVVSYFATKDIRGTVLDEDGLPLPGATIQIKNSTKVVLTNGKGEFELKGIDEKAILVISFIGYKSKEISAGQASPVTIHLETNPGELAEVAIVSTGYQNIPKERAAGSIEVINADKDLKGKLQANILDRIEGMSAGLTSYKSAGNTQNSVRIRGVSTLLGEAKPLYVVDGSPFEGDITSINAADIETITVLKDATAASIYGARSANGVIVINTRRGKKGPVRITYNGIAKLTPLPNRDYTNKMSSSELVDFQREMFNYRSGSYAGIDPRKSMNDVYRLYYEAREGNITETQLQSALEPYRNSDRYDQVVDELLRKTAINQTHNISFSGGSDFYTYNLSGNYMLNNPYEREQSSSRVGFNLNNTFNFTKWMKFDVGVISSKVNEDYDNGILGMNLLNTGKASYFMLKDQNGRNVNWYNSKSQFEIDRLNALGLQDENYSPLAELNKKHYNNTSNYLNLNFAANFKIIDGLSVNLLYQKERTENYTKQYLTKDAYEVKTMLNDAAKQVHTGNPYLIPVGGQLDETRADQNSHTMRAQVNFNKLFGEKHRIDVIAGAEQRGVLVTSSNLYKYGYDDHSLSYKPVDEDFLSTAYKGTEALFGQFTLTRKEKGFVNLENRYASFYANGSYTYDRKLTFTGSIRMDQSNLFGTDPKYQYKPLWSTGVMYVLSENQNDWLDRLAIRTTYGINGNIPKDSGPYMITKDYTSPNTYTKEAYAYVYSPPNAGLRWEKTKVTNFGIDFSLLKSRFSGSIEFYNKATSDLLGKQSTDPTIGWSSVLLNYGSMTNRGVDFTFKSKNITTTDFAWSSGLNFNYNKNELTKLENANNTVYAYLERGQNRVGKPMDALYSVRYKGLDSKGLPIALTKDGREVKSTAQLTPDDLIYSGTTTPLFAASLMNNMSYKNFDLFFMFIYYGGHVMRDVTSPYLTKFAELNYTTNMERSALNYWKKPGDENIPGIAPGFYTAASSTITNIWEARDQNIQKGDYIKLRDVTLSYNLANELLKRNRIQSMRFSFQVQNPWRWAANKQNLDPEAWTVATLVPRGVNNVLEAPSRGIAIPTTYSFGISANF